MSHGHPMTARSGCRPLLVPFSAFEELSFLVKPDIDYVAVVLVMFRIG
jgi:hypothetical protein